MTTTSSSIFPVGSKRALRESPVATQGRRSRRRHERKGRDRPALGGYSDRHGRAREVLTLPGAAGSTLVIDRDRATHGDARLVAHLGADEPAENAALTCRRYLEDATVDDSRCRLLTDEDARVAPFADQTPAELEAPTIRGNANSVDRDGCSYSLELVQSGMSIPELRWCRLHLGQASAFEPLSLREAIAALESYEPMLALTVSALASRRADGGLSTTVLRAELARVQESPIVLNRRLREVVLAVVARRELSMSEIALRCGRIKRDRRGNQSGETSWLARRIGLLPEGGRSTPTPWIHSDVLALIARRGLGLSPREVEP
jgi:hypothetical protein